MTEILRQALQLYYGKDRDGVHVSDLIYCIRRKVFQKLQPTLPTDNDLNNFSRGKGIDGAIEALTMEYPKRFKAKPELWVNGETGDIINWFDARPNIDVIAHPDVWDLENGIPIEMKSNATESANLEKYKAWESPPPASNIKQLFYYMAMSNKTKGKLWVQYINEKKRFSFREIDYSLTPEQLQKEREEIAARARNYRAARDAKNPAIANHVMNDPDYKYLCRGCPYFSPCNDMQKKAAEGKK